MNNQRPVAGVETPPSRPLRADAEPPARRPLRADAERNRRRILAAAREVFARRGLEAGLDEIAHHAGVGIGTVYRRFPDKRDLITALFEDRLDQVQALATSALRHPDPWLGLAGLLESMVAMQIEDRGLKDVLFGDVHETLKRRRGEIEPLFHEVVDRARAVGALRSDVELTDFAALQLMIMHLASVAEPEHPGLWRRHLTLMLDCLQTRRAAPTPLPVPAMTIEEFGAAARRVKARLGRRACAPESPSAQ